MSYKEPNNIFEIQHKFWKREWNTIKKWAVCWKFNDNSYLSVEKKYKTFQSAYQAKKQFEKNEQSFIDNNPERKKRLFFIVRVDYSNIKEIPQCYDDIQPAYIEINENILLREEKLKRILKERREYDID